MKKIDGIETIKRLKNIFSRFGYPYTIKMDNARQFVGEDFSKFCDEYNINAGKTIPYWPQQNGEIERQSVDCKTIGNQSARINVKIGWTR